MGPDPWLREAGQGNLGPDPWLRGAEQGNLGPDPGLGEAGQWRAFLEEREIGKEGERKREIDKIVGVRR